MIKSVHILGHLGLGDHIICNGLVRNYAKTHDRVVIPCYHHNLEAVSFMFRDVKHIDVVGVKDDPESVLLCDQKNCLRLGYFNKEPQPFNPDIFDQEFYRQSHLPFEVRWEEFKVELEVQPSAVKNIKFVHEDLERGFKIDRSYVSDYEIGAYRPSNKTPFWNHYSYLFYATEIHCINSSFLILADSLPDFEDQKLFFHYYSRNTKFPTLKRNWQLIYEPIRKDI